MDGLVDSIGEAHTAQNGADSHLIVVAIARRNLLIEAFVASGQTAVFIAVFARTRDGYFRFREGGKQAFVFCKNLLHFLPNGVEAIVPAVLGKVADARSALSKQLSAFVFKLPEHQANEGSFPLTVCANESNPVPLV